MSLEKKVLKKCYIMLIYLRAEYRLDQNKGDCLKYVSKKVNLLIYFKGTVYLITLMFQTAKCCTPYQVLMCNPTMSSCLFSG